MNTQEKMLLQYLDDTEQRTYPNATIESVNDCNGVVFFQERSECRHYADLHNVSTFDLVQWLYDKLLTEPLKEKR